MKDQKINSFIAKVKLIEILIEESLQRKKNGKQYDYNSHQVNDITQNKDFLKTLEKYLPEKYEEIKENIRELNKG